jgi:hypothetical protein
MNPHYPVSDPSSVYSPGRDVCIADMELAGTASMN